MAGRLAASGGSRKKIVNPAGMTADGRQQSKVQVTNKRSARQCDPRHRLLRGKPLFIFQEIRPEGVQGASGKPPACIGVRQLCRKKIRCWGLGTPTTARESRQLQCPKVPKVRTESPLVSPQAHTPCPGWGLTRRLRRGSETWCPMERSHFSFDGERKGCKRKPAARRLQRRPAPLRVIRKYRLSGHCRARLLYLLRPASR